MCFKAFPKLCAVMPHLVEDYGHEEEVEQEGLRSLAAVELEENDGED